MNVVIYADVVFVINWVMNFFIFWIVSKLIKKNIKIWRIAAGSFVSAGTYCLMIFIPALHTYLNFFTAIIILIIGIVITFAPKSYKECLKLILFAHVAAFAVGGAGIAMFYFTNISQHIGNFVSFTVNNFSVKILIVVTSCTYIIIKLSSAWITRTFIKKQIFYNIEIQFDKKKIMLNALVDTGNSLHDPITKEPVIIVEFDKFKSFLPESTKLLLCENELNDMFAIADALSKTDLAERIRLIPFKSIGKENGILLGIKPDNVIIFSDKKEIQIQKVIIGIHELKLCKDGMYQALLSPNVLENNYL